MNEKERATGCIPPNFPFDPAGEDPVLLAAISLLANDKRIAEISVPFLQQKTGMGHTDAQRAIAFLEEKDILEKAEDAKWQVNRTKLNEHYPF